MEVNFRKSVISNIKKSKVEESTFKLKRFRCFWGGLDQRLADFSPSDHFGNTASLNQ